MCKCEYCGISFEEYKPTQKFCSQTCSNKNTAQKRYIGHSIAYNCETCGKLKTQKLAVYKKAKHHFCSTKCADVYNGIRMSGANHPMWKDGRTPESHRLRHTKEYNDWRHAVYARDYWKCIMCGIKCRGKNIVAHHIKSFKDYLNLRHEVSNGQTLCRSCHKKVHEEIGLTTRFK